MIISLLGKVFGTSNERALKSMQKHVDAINALEPLYISLTDDQLKAKTNEFREKLKNGASLDDILHDAFATVREASKRTLGQRHFDVQLIGGLTLHQGKIAEMKTGEGKTLVATLPSYLNALSGKGVHVVTVNDYLAKRDSEWMGQIYNFLGLSVGCILTNLTNSGRLEAYACDITYGTNNEFGFDYLRDNMRYRLEEMVQRPFNFAIVDEVDSILIDEARTPLIISGPSETSTELYVSVNKLIPKLQSSDFTKDEKLRTVILTDQGTETIEQMLRSENLLTEGNLYDAQNIGLVHHVNQALRAHKLFSRDTDYIVKDSKVIIIDEFTGRMMEGRRFSEGLHQALEAKEGVKIQNENQTLASITFQNYFRMYPKLSGMTGTALTEAAEFAEIYRLGVIEIPTNVHVKRKDHNDKIFKTLAEKDDAIASLIRECQARSQPVLVGTVSIDKSEKLAARLAKLKIPHQVLNARYHEQEAFIIAQAGRPGSVTIATNMAGRGTDIKLGGNLDMRVKQEIDPNLPEDQKQKMVDAIKAEIERDQKAVMDAGGLYVIGTERHESRRIDNQLRGRSGRQGDAGDTMFFLSLEDDLMRIFSPDALQAVLANKQIGLRDNEALTHPWLSKALERAQARVEAQNFEVRKTLLKFDNVMNDQRTLIYAQRREIMESKTVQELTDGMRSDYIHELVRRCIPQQAYAEQWDIETLKSETARVLHLDLPIDAWAKEEGIADIEIHKRLQESSDVLISDKVTKAGEEIFRFVEKSLVLQLLDQGWKEHLLQLDHLRQGINLRAFAQRDPLNEFKTEAFALFEAMLNNLREAVVRDLSHIDINMTIEPLMRALRAKEAPHRETRDDPALMGTGEFTSARQKNQAEGRIENFPVRHQALDKGDPSTWVQTPRNSLCPCESGKKYKHCHGAINQQTSIT